MADTVQDECRTSATFLAEGLTLGSCGVRCLMLVWTLESLLMLMPLSTTLMCADGLEKLSVLMLIAVCCSVSNVVRKLTVLVCAVLVTAIGAAVERLRNQHIDVLLPNKFKTLANVDMVCFDKTGTLTATTVSTL